MQQASECFLQHAKYSDVRFFEKTLKKLFRRTISLIIEGMSFFQHIFFCPVAHIRQPSLGGKVDKPGFHDTVHELAAHSDLWNFFFFLSSFLP